MIEIVERELLGYKIETFNMHDFKEYYDENTNRFNTFSRSAFLKAISIPPSYFLEQPEETQEELLENKSNLMEVQPKYTGWDIIVVSKGNEIVNAGKIKSVEVEMRFEQIASIEDVDNIVWDRTYHKDGFISGYLVCGTVSKEGYSRILTIDLPILFNKPTTLHEGFLKLANPKMDVEKDMVYYTCSSDVDYNDYQHIQLAIVDKLNNMPEMVSLDREDSKLITREPVAVICELVDEKVIPKSLLNPIAKYIDGQIDEGKPITNISFTETCILFDQNVKSLKQVNGLRSCKDYIDNICSNIVEVEKELVGLV